jgi:hypothetical protein
MLAEDIEISIDRLASEMEPDLPDAELAAAQAKMLSFMESRYTMSAERELHASLTGANRFPLHEAHTIDSQGKGHEDLSDILF